MFVENDDDEYIDSDELSDDIFRSVEAFSSDDDDSGYDRNMALLDEKDGEQSDRNTRKQNHQSVKSRAKSAVSSQSKRSLKVERKLSKLKEENKDNPKMGVTWYLIYCVVKSALLILTSLLFSMNNHPDDPTRNLSPF